MNEDRIRELVGLLAAEVEPKPIPAPSPVIAQPAPPAGEPLFEDYGKFFDHLRGTNVLGPKISSDEFTGCSAIILACQNARWGISWTAYALATSYLETAMTMQPIKELGGTAYFTRMYDIRGNRPAKAKELGNLTPGDGAKYPGRGYVQLTGLENYRKMTAKLRAIGINVDLVANPDLAMRPDVAAAIMVIGMEEGSFTTRKLADDLPRRGTGTLRQFVMSRDIINGTDKDDEIAAVAMVFQAALVVGGYREL